MEKKIRTSRLGRFAELAGLGVRAGADVLRGRGDASAEQALAVLGGLRGLATKVGQMASYVDGVVPEGQRAAFEATLKALQSQAPRSSFADIQKTIEQELGRPLEQLFVSFEEVPLASASMGQVHRATLREADGRTVDVAVKVQHTGIRAAVDADLGNLGMLGGFSSLVGASRFDAKTFVGVVNSRFREELDYALEAARTERFATIHAGDPNIRVPEVYRSHSSASVLCTTFVRGMSFDEACLAPEEERKSWAETLWKFVFKGILIHGVFNADPHPGNFLFHPGGGVTFLDHGCVQELPEDHLVHARDMHLAAMDRAEDAFRGAMGRLAGARPGVLEEAAFHYTRTCFEPLWERPYEITQPWTASLVDRMKSMGLLARKVPESQFFNLPPDMIFMNRLQFGFYSLLARLHVAADYSGVERAFLARSAVVP